MKKSSWSVCIRTLNLLLCLGAKPTQRINALLSTLVLLTPFNFELLSLTNFNSTGIPHNLTTLRSVKPRKWQLRKKSFSKNCIHSWLQVWNFDKPSQATPSVQCRDGTSTGLGSKAKSGLLKLLRRLDRASSLVDYQKAWVMACGYAMKGLEVDTVPEPPALDSRKALW